MALGCMEAESFILSPRNAPPDRRGRTGLGRDDVLL
jgi:hypothetical protein